jgi:uncharacterized protein (DUF169 family)
MERLREKGENLQNFLHLKSHPVGVSFLEEGGDIPLKVRRPRDRGLAVTICQAMTWARVYGWAVAVKREDNLCIPAGLAFRFLESSKMSNAQALSRYMVEAGWSSSLENTQDWHILDIPCSTLLMEPLRKAQVEPQVVVIYGDPSQIVKLIHGYSYTSNKRIQSRISGRVACSDCLIAPLILNEPVISIPGTGDRVFSATQDTELTLSLPYPLLNDMLKGMREAGKKIGGNRYPFVPYMLHQVQFPSMYEELARELGIETPEGGKP